MVLCVIQFLIGYIFCFLKIFFFGIQVLFSFFDFLVSFFNFLFCFRNQFFLFCNLFLRKLHTNLIHLLGIFFFIF